MTITRHFTATGFVIDSNRMLIHWHSKVGAWLPPGGHINENEDPVQAVLREINEEAGVIAEVVPTGPSLDLTYPSQIHSPFAIMLEDIQDPVNGYHQHIDLIYFCRISGSSQPLNHGWYWIHKEQLLSNDPVRYQGGESICAPEDVRQLALQAFEVINA